MKEYFYRRLGSPDFEASASEKEILPLRLKSRYVDESQCYDIKDRSWKIFNQTDLAGKVAVEFIETPAVPRNLYLHYDLLVPKHSRLFLEDLDINQMKEYLAFREAKKRFEYNRANLQDSEKRNKDCFAIEVDSDEEKLTFKITLKRFKRSRYKEDVETLLQDYDYNPFVEDEVVLFDLKDGSVTLNTSSDFSDNDFIYDNEMNLEEKKRITFSDLYQSKVYTLNLLEEFYFPRNVKKTIFESFLKLVSDFTEIPLQSLLEHYDFKHIKNFCLFEELYNLTVCPFEPKLAQVMGESLYDLLKIKFNFKRKDPDVFKHFCRKNRIRNTKIVRRAFLSNPESLLTNIILRKCGFSDINFYNQVLENPDNCKFFNHSIIEHLACFSRYCIRKRGQKVTMKLLLKEYDSEDHSIYKYDIIEMFAMYFKYIPKRLKDDICKNGFTEFNHDALVNISYLRKTKKFKFSYLPEEKSLIDHIEDYEFLLPKDSYQLCDIGTVLHNCVASYAQRVKNKECTIVYARKNGEYQVCIEVCGSQVCQELVNHNDSPSEEEQRILNLWHARHGLRLAH